MTPLPTDSLVFKVPEQEAIPTEPGSVTFQLLGEGGELIEPAIMENAAAAVLHYFREDLGREAVPVAEFSAVLEKVLHGLGLNITWGEATPAANPAQRTTQADLRELVKETGPGFELVFFQRLRDEVRRSLQGAPGVLRFGGLRGCVQQMTGAKRWTGRCQELHDQIVDYLRQCLRAEHPGQACALVVR